MLIRKLFKFENAHVVRGCSTRRCSHSIHGHSCKVELLLEAHALDGVRMGRIDLDAIEFSPAIVRQWRDPELFERLKRGERLPAAPSC